MERGRAGERGARKSRDRRGLKKNSIERVVARPQSSSSRASLTHHDGLVSRAHLRLTEGVTHAPSDARFNLQPYTPSPRAHTQLLAGAFHASSAYARPSRSPANILPVP